MTTLNPLSDPRDSDRQQAERDAEPVSCAHCGHPLADRRDVSPSAGIEWLDEAFCDWPCADKWARDRIEALYESGMLPRDWREV